MKAGTPERCQALEQAYSPCVEKCRATREEEQAVFTAEAGPRRPKAKARRPAMKLSPLPVLATGLTAAAGGKVAV